MTSTNAPEDLKQDLFGFELDYLPNGNIQKMEWNHKGEEAQHYSYTYDALNRIKTATHSSGNYNVSGITYDKNGNIQTLNRQGYLGSGFGSMDALGYEYTGNQLTKVTDSGNTSYGFKARSSSYGYDVNGNMTSDSGKGIGITYNHLNLPETVTKGSENITYLYDASGIKLKKTVGSHTTAYTGTAVYKDGKLEFINHAEGYIEKDGAGYKYIYRLTDHLGNTRVTFKNKNTDKTITADEVIETNDYYPFGLQHKKDNRPLTASNLGQNYKFGGKELSEELGLDTYDFGARNYDASLGRWMNIDPLAEKFYSYSTYNAMNNDPINFVDPTGMVAEWRPELNEDGSTSYIAEAGDSAETLASQYGLSQDDAETITGTTGDTEIAEGTEISGQTVNDVTGSEVLKLDLSSKEGRSSQRRFDQFLFARDHSRSQGAHSFLSTDYYSNTAYHDKMSGRAKMEVDGQTVNVLYNIPLYRSGTFDNSNTATALSNSPFRTKSTSGRSFPNQVNIHLEVLHPNTGKKMGDYTIFVNGKNENKAWNRLSKKFPKYNYIRNLNNTFKN